MQISSARFYRMKDEIDELKKQRDKLMNALKPFAENHLKAKMDTAQGTDLIDYPTRLDYLTTDYTYANEVFMEIRDNKNK